MPYGIQKWLITQLCKNFQSNRADGPPVLANTQAAGDSA